MSAKPKTSQLSKEDLDKLYGTIHSTKNTDKDDTPPKITAFTGNVFFNKEKTSLGTREFEKLEPQTEVARYKLMTGIGQTLASQLKGFLQSMPNGPWFPDGRDEELIIRNRNYNQAPLYHIFYKKEPGNCISFNVKTTRKKVTLDAASTSNINPEHKEVVSNANQMETPQTTNNACEKYFYQEEVNGQLYFLPRMNQDLANSSSLSEYKRINKSHPSNKTDVTKKAKSFKETQLQYSDEFKPNEEDRQSYMDQLKKAWESELDNAKNGNFIGFLDATNLPKYVVKRKTWVRRWINPYKFWKKEMGPNTIQSEQYTFAQWQEAYNYISSKPNIVIIPKKDNTNYGPDVVAGGGMGNVLVASYELVDVPIDGAKILATVLPQDFNKIVIDNMVKKAIREEISADFRHIGVPYAMTSKILRVHNVSKKYSGDYYITRIKHSINQSGYSCEGTAIKKGTSHIINGLSSRVVTKKLYAGISSLAQSKLDRDKAGLSIEDMVNTEIEKFRAIQKSEAAKRNEDTAPIENASYQAILESNGSLKVYRAKEDVINIDKSRSNLKKQLKKK